MNMSDIRILQTIENHNFEADNRILIPFVQYHKYGFMTRERQIVVPAKYDFIYGEFENRDSLVRVGLATGKGYTRKSDEVKVYLGKVWGLIDSNGKLIVDCEYDGIIISDDQKHITLRDSVKGYTLIDRNGNTIIPYGTYNYMDGADHGLVRVKQYAGVDNNQLPVYKWGIVDTSGNIVLPIKYSWIWNFHGKNRLSTRVEIDGHSENINFSSLMHVDNVSSMEAYEPYDEYGTHYGEFEGSYAQYVMGYSDDVINDAFEGDPDAYWNID